jgi:hypothetical protein
MDNGPVPGRECGACDACCVLFEITEPSIAKAAGVPCRHLTKGGCAVYESRPQTCRSWLCGWRLIASLPEDWRPDLSGILVYQMACREPGYGPDALIVSLSRGRDYLASMSLLGFIQHMVECRVPLYLTAHSGKAENHATFLNARLESSVQARDGAAFLRILTPLISSACRQDP